MQDTDFGTALGFAMYAGGVTDNEYWSYEKGVKTEVVREGMIHEVHNIASYILREKMGWSYRVIAGQFDMLFPSSALVAAKLIRMNPKRKEMVERHWKRVDHPSNRKRNALMNDPRNKEAAIATVD